MRLLTGSKIDLARHCNYWLRDEAEWDESVGQAAKTGSQVHAQIESAIMRRPDPPGSVSPKSLRIFRQWAAWIYGTYNHRRPENVEPEVILARHIGSDEARALVPSGPRDYSGAVCGEDVAMTVDAIFYDHDDECRFIHVIDWKTGRPVTKAAENGQLATAAYMLSSLYGVDRVKVQLVYLREDGVDDSDSAWLGPLEHAITRRRLKLAMVPGPAKTGPWCRALFCPHRKACSALNQQQGATP